jgi:hypothetical protein
MSGIRWPLECHGSGRWVYPFLVAGVVPKGSGGWQLRLGKHLQNGRVEGVYGSEILGKPVPLSRLQTMTTWLDVQSLLPTTTPFLLGVPLTLVPTAQVFHGTRSLTGGNIPGGSQKQAS